MTMTVFITIKIVFRSAVKKWRHAVYRSHKIDKMYLCQWSPSFNIVIHLKITSRWASTFTLASFCFAYCHRIAFIRILWNHPSCSLRGFRCVLKGSDYYGRQRRIQQVAITVDFFNKFEEKKIKDGLLISCFVDRRKKCWFGGIRHDSKLGENVQYAGGND